MMTKAVWGSALLLLLACARPVRAQQCLPPYCVGGGGAEEVRIMTNGTNRILVSSTGNITFVGSIVTPLFFPSGTVSAPSITTSDATSRGIYFPSTVAIGFSISGTLAMQVDNTAVTLTNGFSLQYSSGSVGTADTTISRTAAGKLQLAGTTPVLQLGGATVGFPSIKRSGADLHVRFADDSGYANIVARDMTADTGRFIGWVGRSSLSAGADKLIELTDSAAATGEQMNFGSATLGTCTGGTITTGSHNFAGGYTGNTSGSCIINFGTPNWTNAPFCLAMSIASTTHPRVSATATSSITITGGVSGEAITYMCKGRIGT